MAKAFRVDVVSPEATVWSGEATFVVARTPDGEIGIMADHEPTLAALVTSAVVIEREDGERITIGVHGGFLQVLRNQVTLLTDSARLAPGREAAATLAEELREAAAAAQREMGSFSPPG
jgi:F-type H+-transporting ATPase subunit epsilon